MTEAKKTPEVVDAKKAAAAGPVVVDLGRKKKKAIKRLSRGSGRLMDQVSQLLVELKAAGTVGAGAVPVVVVVKEKKAKGAGLFGRR